VCYLLTYDKLQSNSKSESTRRRERERCVVLLHGAQLNADDELALGGNVLEDVGLETPQQVTSEQLVKAFDLLLLRDVGKLLQEQLQVAVATTSTRPLHSATLSMMHVWVML